MKGSNASTIGNAILISVNVSLVFSCEMQADDKTSIAIDDDKTSPDLLSTICISLILTVSSNVVARITSFDKSPYVDVLLPLKLAVAFALPSNVFFPAFSTAFVATKLPDSLVVLLSLAVFESELSAFEVAVNVNCVEDTF